MTNEQNIEQGEETVDPNINIENSDIKEPEPIEADVLKAQLTESNDKFLRLYAEFDNYKRRTIKERSEIIQTAGKEVIISLLPVIDDFERAIKVDTQDFEGYKEGIKLIYHKFNATLESKGLKAIQSIGNPFNVDVHEAITSIPAPSEDLKGKVVDEAEKGYMLNGQVVRFAKVIIGE